MGSCDNTWFFIGGKNNNIANITRQIFERWCPPPASVLDLTHGKGYTTSLLKTTDLEGNKYTFTTIDISPDSSADIIADMREPDKIEEIQGKQYDIIYCDPPYNTIERFLFSEKSKICDHIKTTYSRGYLDCLSLVSALPKYKKYMKPTSVLILKIGDRQKNRVLIPQHIESYNILKDDFILRQIYVYGYRVRFISRHNYFMIFTPR